MSRIAFGIRANLLSLILHESMLVVRTKNSLHWRLYKFIRRKREFAAMKFYPDLPPWYKAWVTAVLNRNCLLGWIANLVPRASLNGGRREEESRTVLRSKSGTPWKPWERGWWIALLYVGFTFYSCFDLIWSHQPCIPKSQKITMRGVKNTAVKILSAEITGAQDSCFELINVKHFICIKKQQYLILCMRL